MPSVSLSAIVSDYRDRKLKSELATDWGSVVFYRAPAFVLAWLLAPLGVTPNQVTAAGSLLIPGMALAAWYLPPAQAAVVILLIGIAFNVLDCTDGALARALDMNSVSGRYMDFASDILFRLTAYASFGIVADRQWPGAPFPWLAVGLCCGLLGLYARVNRIYAEDLYVEEHFEEALEEPRPPVDMVHAPGKRSAFSVAFSVLSGLDTLLPILAFLAWEAGVLRGALLWFLIYTLGDTIIEVVGTYLRVRKIDARELGKRPRP